MSITISLKAGLLFFLLWAPFTVYAVLVDKIAAIVNNDVVLNSHIEHFEKTTSLRKELDPLFGFSLELENAKPNRNQILEFLIQEHLIAQNFKVQDSEVEQEIQSVQRNNNLTRETLVEFLKSKGFTFDEYLELMRIGLQKRTLLDREIRSRVNISDDDVRNYFYNLAIKSSKAPIEYQLQIISIHFKTYKNSFAAQQTAEEIWRSLKRGEAFSDVAKRASDDSSAHNGGDLGYVSYETLDEALRPSVQKLRIGEISDLIKGSQDYKIIKLNDIRSTESQKFLEMKEQIRELLAKEEYKKQLYLWAERMRNNAYVHVNP